MYTESVDFQFAFQACQSKNARLATLADGETQDNVTGKKSQNKTATVTDVIVQREGFQWLVYLPIDGRVIRSFVEKYDVASE